MTPTPEQSAIISAVAANSNNLLVSALAGAAKTSTLVLIAEAVPDTPALCLAFNKRIAEEMNTRLPSNCEAKTLNSLGHRAWSDTIGRRCQVKTDKIYSLLKTEIEKLTKGEKEEAYGDMAETMKMVEQGKSRGYVPSGSFDQARRLMDDDEFYESLDEEPSELQWALVRTVTRKSIAQAFDGVLDFADQLLMPTVFQSVFPFFPLVLVDEYQDFSELNQVMLQKIVKRRVIAVGDECQSIYAFRGADQNAMRNGAKRFHMDPYLLSISFRCPQSVVREARWRAPHMQWPDWAIEGQVTTRAEWGVEDIPNTAAIVCRNNAPLFGAAIKLLKNGRYPQIVGNDVGKGLVKHMTKFGPGSMSRAEAEIRVDRWLEEKHKKMRNKGLADDQAQCMRIFLEQGETLGDAIAYANHLMTSQGPVQMMTGHKSKGLEYPNVFILDQGLLRLDEQQDQNLKYVMQTRAKETLTYLTTEGFVE